MLLKAYQIPLVLYQDRSTHLVKQNYCGGYRSVASKCKKCYLKKKKKKEFPTGASDFLSTTTKKAPLQHWHLIHKLRLTPTYLMEHLTWCPTVTELCALLSITHFNLEQIYEALLRQRSETEAEKTSPTAVKLCWWRTHSRGLCKLIHWPISLFQENRKLCHLTTWSTHHFSLCTPTIKSIQTLQMKAINN